jgi:hypothetical protein
MRTLIPTRAKAVLLAVALAVPMAAQAAGPKDQVYALIAAARALGDESRAEQLEALTAAMSDEDAQRLVDGGIAQLTEAFRQLAQQRALSEQQGVPSQSRQQLMRGLTNSAGLPVGDYPDPAKCFTSPDGSNFDALFITFTTVKTARTAFEAANDFLKGLFWGCETVVVAIGIGGNPQTVACAIAEIALAIANTALNVAEETLDIVDFCDGAIQFVDGHTTLERTEHIHDDLETARTQILDRLDTHDTDIKALLAAIMAQLTVIENKVDLGLKSQAEIAMHRKFRTRPSVFYEERLDEICGYAQEAINDLPVVYLAASAAQDIYDRAIQFKITDPKRAADECIRAYLQATVRSDAIQ